MDRRRNGATCARLAVAALLGLGAACAPQPKQPWLSNAVEDAATQRKPLIVAFYATWCGPCRHFENHILTDPRVQAALADVVFVRYDIEGATGRDAAARCRSRAVPTVVGIDRSGVLRLIKKGTEQTPHQFLAFIAQAKRVLAAPAR